jgi:hypothetical protein
VGLTAEIILVSIPIDRYGPLGGVPESRSIGPGT